MTGFVLIPKTLELTTYARGSAIILYGVHPHTEKILSGTRSHREELLPQQSDQTANSENISSPELNPLLNPLLAENMGRWAETYFTNSPENREQAVLDLIRQLEAERAAREGNRNAAPANGFMGDIPAAPRALDARDAVLPCATCGHQNPSPNRFCGMCGSPIGEERQDDYQQVGPEDSNQDWSGVREPYDPPPSNGNNLSLFQTTSGTEYDNGNWMYEPEPKRPYRLLVGVFLAAIILGLGYLAWHGMQNSQLSGTTAAPPPVAKEAEPPAPSPAPPTASADNSERPALNKAQQSAASKTAEAPAEPAPAKSAKASPVVSRSPAKPTPAPQVQPTDGNGGEELAIAHGYLTGSNGRPRDTAEGAKWLWKSIAKHNAQASVLLADLYLKGDGVSKNCDQARVLLDSAARKGVSGAGERLRNLQAFGCQ